MSKPQRSNCSNHRRDVVCLWALFSWVTGCFVWLTALQKNTWLGWATCESHRSWVFYLDKYQKGQVLLRISSGFLAGEIKFTGVLPKDLYCKLYQKCQEVPSLCANKGPTLIIWRCDIFSWFVERDVKGLRERQAETILVMSVCTLPLPSEHAKLFTYWWHIFYPLYKRKGERETWLFFYSIKGWEAVQSLKWETVLPRMLNLYLDTKHAQDCPLSLRLADIEWPLH